MTPADTLVLSEADVAIARADIEAALIGHRPLIDRKPKQRRPATDSTIALARRLERLARAALPLELQRLRREPTELWLLANDPERAEAIDAKRAGIGMQMFDPEDPADVARVLRNDALRARLSKTAAGNARQIGEGEFEIAAHHIGAAPAELLLEAEQTLQVMRAAGLIDAAWHRLTARPASCGDASDDAEALPAAGAAERLGCSVRSVQTHMQVADDAERGGGQLVLPGVPRVRDVYKARPRDGEVTP